PAHCRRRPCSRRSAVGRARHRLPHGTPADGRLRPSPVSRLCCVADADAIVRRRALVPAGQVIEAWNDLYTPGHFWLGEESKRLLDAAGEPVPPVITLPAAAVAVYYGPQLTDLESLPPEDSLKAPSGRRRCRCTTARRS